MSEATQVLDGFIHFPNYLSEQEQIDIAAISRDPSVDEKFKLVGRNRHRIYDAVGAYPNSEQLLEIVNRILMDAHEIDESILTDLPTHLLFLKYVGRSRIGMHRDDGENDGAGLNPVVSLSIGNTCTFAFKNKVEDETQSITLKSGDVVVFGGASRYMLHSVPTIEPESSPPFLSDPTTRFNLTFRYAPNIIGREDSFQTFKNSLNKRYYNHDTGEAEKAGEKGEAER